MECNAQYLAWGMFIHVANNNIYLNWLLRDSTLMQGFFPLLLK